MAVQYTVPSGLAALTAATARTLVEITAGANVPVEAIALSVSTSYTTTGTPITLVVEIGTITATGTGTTATPKRSGAASGSAAFTAKINDTVEPSGFAPIRAWDLFLPGDRLDYQWPLGREIMVPTSTLLAVRLTASAACSARATLDVEE